MLELDTIWTRQKKLSEERLKICRECPKYEKVTTRCSECGCFMVAKTMLTEAKCPLDKWGPGEYNET